MDIEITKMWLDILSDSIKILGPAAITGVLAYKTGKAQHDLRIKELEKNNEFKAREKLFDFHKGKLEENKEALANLANEMGQFAGMTAADRNDELKINEFVNGFISTYIDNLPFAIDHIQNEMKLYPGELEQEKEKLKEIAKASKKLTKPEVPGDVQSTITELMRIYSFLGHCIRMLIEKEAVEIFKPYTGNA